MVTLSSEIASRIHLGSIPLRMTAFAPDYEVAKPVHLGPGVVKGRNAQKIVGMGLMVVAVFNVTGKLEISVRKKSCLGGTGRSRGKIKGGAIGNIEFDPGVNRFSRREHFFVGLGVFGPQLLRAHKDKTLYRIQVGPDGIYSFDKLFAEDKYLGFGDMRAPF